jgi:hypothetical protein
MTAVLPENDTPCFEGICDLNGNPIKIEKESNEYEFAT